MLIVDTQPPSRDLPHGLQTPKQIEIEHFIPRSAIEPLDKPVPRGAAGLNVRDQHLIGFLPILKGLRDESWDVIHPDHVW